MTADALMAAALRGEFPPWPSHLDPGEVCRAAEDHGVAPLLAGTTAAAQWPAAARAGLQGALRIEAAREAALRPELTKVVRAFHDAGVRVLLIKGAHLAYARYPRPWLRPRADTDLFVGEADRPRAAGVMGALGYQPVTGFEGELVTHQFQYCRGVDGGVVHYVDLHWKIANPHVFSSTLQFEDVDRQSVAIAELGPGARGPCDVHALLAACVHRVAHHRGSGRLIWLFDIHLLSGSLDAAGRGELERAARSRGVLAVCGESIAEARALFGTAVPDEWLAELRREGGEATAHFMQGAGTKFGVLRSDMAALPGWRARVRLIREHLFPPAAYIRRTYNVRHSWLLPLVYAWRIAAGARRWFR